MFFSGVWLSVRPFIATYWPGLLVWAFEKKKKKNCVTLCPAIFWKPKLCWNFLLKTNICSEKNLWIHLDKMKGCTQGASGHSVNVFFPDFDHFLHLPGLPRLLSYTLITYLCLLVCFWVMMTSVILTFSDDVLIPSCSSEDEAWRFTDLRAHHHTL